jgi:hypothetical protein
MVDQNLIVHTQLLSRRSRQYFVVHPTRIVFYILFFLVFCFSGLITMLDIVPYRMGVMALLVLPLVILYGIRPDRVSIAYMFLALVIGVSALYNGSSLSDTILFSRIIVFSYLTYYIVDRFVKPTNVERIIKLCVLIALIQLPVVLFQLSTYDWLSVKWQEDIIAIDYDFGTFNYKGDSSMSFFLILLIAFLLFDDKRKYVIKHWPWVVIWLTATVFIANSDISKLILILIWLVYFVTHLKRRATIIIIVSGAFLLSILFTTGIGIEVKEVLQHKILRTAEGLKGNPAAVETYLSGGYSRGGAIYYYLNREILWLGDGPNRYSDPFSRERLRGNVGHIFTFYSEIGLFGWFLSMAIFFLIAFRPRGKYLRMTPYTILLFSSIFVLSFTNEIMNDISVVMIFVIMSKSYLIPSMKQS